MFFTYHLFREIGSINMFYMFIVNDTVLWNPLLLCMKPYENYRKWEYFPYQLVQDFFQEQ